jgi:hypothetical protein
VRSRDKASILGKVEAAYGLGGNDAGQHISTLLDGDVFIYNKSVLRRKQDPNVEVRLLLLMFHKFTCRQYPQHVGVGRPFKNKIILTVIDIITFKRSERYKSPFVCDILPEAFGGYDDSTRTLPIPLYAFACTLVSLDSASFNFTHLYCSKIQYALTSLRSWAANTAAAPAAGDSSNARADSLAGYDVHYKRWLELAQDLFFPADTASLQKMEQLRRQDWDYIRCAYCAYLKPHHVLISFNQCKVWAGPCCSCQQA